MSFTSKKPCGNEGWWIPATVSAGLALCLYSVTLRGVYIYDDVQVVTEDSRLKDLHAWGEIWTKDYWNKPPFLSLDNLYRPLVTQSYALEWWIHGDRAWVFHLINVLLHAAVAGCVAELGRRLFNWRVGLIAGLLFASHPVHAEAVAGIVGRADLACTLGIVGLQVLFLRPMTIARAFAIGSFTMLALLTKESGLLVPGFLLALAPARRLCLNIPPRSESVAKNKTERSGMLWLILVVSWTVAGLIVLREEILHLRFEWDRSFLDFTIQPLVRAPSPDRWLIPIALIGRYLGLLVAPTHLSIDYGIDIIRSTIARNDPYLWLGAVTILVGIASLVMTVIHKRWRLAFCLLGLGLSYAVVSNFLMLGAIMGERLMYLPSVFFILIVALFLAKLPKRIGATVVALLVAAGCIRTFTYIRHWDSRSGFYEYSVEAQPRSVKIHLLDGEYYLEDGHMDIEKAVSEFEVATRLAPDDPNSWDAMGLAEEKSQDWPKAMEYYKQAYKLQPSTPREARIDHAAEMILRGQAGTQRS